MSIDGRPQLIFSTSCGHAENTIIMSISALSTTYCPGLQVGASNELEFLFPCTGIFINRFNGLGVNPGGVIPIPLQSQPCSQSKLSQVYHILPSLIRHRFHTQDKYPEKIRNSPISPNASPMFPSQLRCPSFPPQAAPNTATYHTPL